MSDRDQSYYEIALTNRQVVVAFVILLGCLMGSFFTGVWIGRDEAAESGPRPAQQQAGGDDTRPLDFFSGGELDGEETGAAEDTGVRATAPRPSPSAAPAQDPAELRARREAAERQRREAAAQPEESVAGGEGAALGPQAPPATPPQRTPPQGATGGGSTPRQPAAGATRQPTAAAPAGGPVIQVFSSADREQAQKVVRRLEGGGQRAFLSPVEVGGTTMYRVRIGPFADRDQAEKVAERVRREFRYDTWITQ